jgi:glycosyltransferase involved in cell wall biosynthesis
LRFPGPDWYRLGMANIGFVSTRFAGSDGVSLESDKWARTLELDGHTVFWFAGELDRPAEVSMLVPEAHFTHPDAVRIGDAVWGRLHRSPEINALIKSCAEFLRRRLYDFVERFGVEILVIQNAVTIPMQIPLGIAITDFVGETGIPTIAHHHDFYWERTRFGISAVRDYLEMAFPPVLPQVQHAVINSAARDQLAWRKGVSSLVVPNVIDFEHPPVVDPAAREHTRAAVGLAEGDRLILQPTRVVPRKGIEHAITVVSRLNDSRCKLVISHESGDEGDSYLSALMELAAESRVDLRMVRAELTEIKDGVPVPAPGGALSLWDLYAAADLVTYPSLYEGFGNALLEAFYFRVPVLVNRYSIFVQDIEPKGFRTISMDGFVTSDVVRGVRTVLDSPELRRDMVETNYTQAARYYGFMMLRRRLQTLIINVLGMD